MSSRFPDRPRRRPVWTTREVLSLSPLARCGRRLDGDRSRTDPEAGRTTGRGTRGGGTTRPSSERGPSSSFAPPIRKATTTMTTPPPSRPTAEPSTGSSTGGPSRAFQNPPHVSAPSSTGWTNWADPSARTSVPTPSSRTPSPARGGGTRAGTPTPSFAGWRTCGRQGPTPRSGPTPSPTRPSPRRTPIRGEDSRRPSRPGRWPISWRG
mmetsp:Transcript_21543/g.63130  ORF Transcript_21543/g.63130 Transcript_21543/m.63130 type:complete len:209 (+) Transcript_21543:651-1277(+)